MPLESIRLVSGQSVKLGRIRPLAQVEFENFVLTVLPGGQVVRTIKFKRYYNATQDTAPPPTKIDYATKAMASLKRMYLNDQYGDCVIAGKYHQVGVWTANDNTQGEQAPIQGSDQEVLSAYNTICGPGDNGCVITDVLDWMRTKGLSFNGQIHKIDDYVAVDWTNKQLVQVAIEVFGGGTIGIDLPSAWTCTDCTWDVTNTRVIGGHDVAVIDYNETGPRIATWAGIVQMTWKAFCSRQWVSEFYIPLAPDWYGKDNLAPNGIDSATLKADLDKLRQGVIPDPGPVVPPQPTCPPGQHWDVSQNKCVPDDPGPTPPPVTMTGTLTIPALPVTTNVKFITGQTQSITLPITVSSQHAAPAEVPWELLAQILKQGLQFVCQNPTIFPPAWQPLIQILCTVAPKAPCAGCQ